MLKTFVNMFYLVLYNIDANYQAVLNSWLPRMIKSRRSQAANRTDGLDQFIREVQEGSRSNGCDTIYRPFVLFPFGMLGFHWISRDVAPFCVQAE